MRRSAQRGGVEGADAVATAHSKDRKDPKTFSNDRAQPRMAGMKNLPREGVKPSASAKVPSLLCCFYLLTQHCGSHRTGRRARCSGAHI
jgi:hypothetical protein